MCGRFDRSKFCRKLLPQTSPAMDDEVSCECNYTSWTGLDPWYSRFDFKWFMFPFLVIPNRLLLYWIGTCKQNFDQQLKQIPIFLHPHYFGFFSLLWLKPKKLHQVCEKYYMEEKNALESMKMNEYDFELSETTVALQSKKYRYNSLVFQLIHKQLHSLPIIPFPSEIIELIFNYAYQDYDPEDEKNIDANPGINWQLYQREYRLVEVLKTQSICNMTTLKIILFEWFVRLYFTLRIGLIFASIVVIIYDYTLFVNDQSLCNCTYNKSNNNIHPAYAWNWIFWHRFPWCLILGVSMDLIHIFDIDVEKNRDYIDKKIINGIILAAEDEREDKYEDNCTYTCCRELGLFIFWGIFFAIGAIFILGGIIIVLFGIASFLISVVFPWHWIIICFAARYLGMLWLFKPNSYFIERWTMIDKHYMPKWIEWIKDNCCGGRNSDYTPPISDQVMANVLRFVIMPICINWFIYVSILVFLAIGWAFVAMIDDSDYLEMLWGMYSSEYCVNFVDIPDFTNDYIASVLLWSSLLV